MRVARMSTHLLETSDEDSFLLVARFVGDLLNEGEVRWGLDCGRDARPSAPMPVAAAAI